MVLNTFGRILEYQWKRIPHFFPFVQLDAFQIMPNHFHGIIITDIVGAMHSGGNFGKYENDFSENALLLPQRAHGTKPGSLGAALIASLF